MTELETYKVALRIALRYAPKFVRDQINAGLVRRDMTPYEKAITGVDQRATERLIAGLKKSQ